MAEDLRRPYRPSNGTEGEIFMGKWCASCALDCYGKGYLENEGEPNCEILADALAGGNPREWISDARGPRCTAFRLDGDAPAFDPEIGRAHV